MPAQYLIDNAKVSNKGGLLTHILTLDDELEVKFEPTELPTLLALLECTDSIHATETGSTSAYSITINNTLSEPIDDPNAKNPKCL